MSGCASFNFCPLCGTAFFKILASLFFLYFPLPSSDVFYFLHGVDAIKWKIIMKEYSVLVPIQFSRHHTLHTYPLHSWGRTYINSSLILICFLSPHTHTFSVFLFTFLFSFASLLLLLTSLDLWVRDREKRQILQNICTPLSLSC